MNEKLLDLAVKSIERAQLGVEACASWRAAVQAAEKLGLHPTLLASLHKEEEGFARYVERRAEHDASAQPPRV